MKLVDNAREVWKHYSTKALVTIASLGFTWASLPDGIKELLPHWAAQGVAWIVFIAALFGIGGKFVDQTKPEDKP